MRVDVGSGDEAVGPHAQLEGSVLAVRAVTPEFEVTTANTETVARICWRLDGLPLATELAAARIKLFSPHAMLEGLDHRLDLLVGGARDLPDRQRTLRDTVAWSYDLLDVGEQTLFRQLSVFAGGGRLWFRTGSTRSRRRS